MVSVLEISFTGVHFRGCISVVLLAGHEYPIVGCNEPCHIGIRRIGKIGILTDLDDYFREHEHKEAKYVDYINNPQEARQSC